MPIGPHPPVEIEEMVYASKIWDRTTNWMAEKNRDWDFRRLHWHCINNVDLYQLFTYCYSTKDQQNDSHFFCKQCLLFSSAYFQRKNKKISRLNWRSMTSNSCSHISVLFHYNIVPRWLLTMYVVPGTRKLFPIFPLSLITIFS